MSAINPPVTKRTVLVVQFWTLAVLTALANDNLPLAAALVAAAVYLRVGPVPAWLRRARTSRLLLRAE